MILHPVSLFEVSLKEVNTRPSKVESYFRRKEKDEKL